MTDIERLAAALAGRYRIDRELGAGGMATVYLAEDVKHRRQVAVKVLRPQLAAAVGADRFLREIEIAASLHHPHILPLYDSGEADGFLFYVMPFVEGESLRQRLDREKQLPLDDALHIAREVADALSFAHSRGVVHRDVKPENILLESGHAVVADFGIARALSMAGGESLTETGMLIGTPRYMSPEQAGGAAEIDGRSDLYSLGCTLFEMLAGQPPFTGPSPEAVIRQHLAADPPPVTNYRPAVPRHLAGTIARALAKAPADRFNPVAQFGEALLESRERSSVARAASADADRPSVAVLPFVNMSPDSDNEYFSDGMTEEIINALSRLEGLRVASRTSAFAFKGKGADLATVGERLNVGTVLEGSVRKAGNRVRVTAQLIRIADDDHLWSDRFDSALEDIFAVQDRIAQAIVDVLRVKLLGDKAAFVAPGTKDVRAYELYLKGRYFWNKRDERDVRRGITHFEEAVASDATYALAHVGLADSYNILGFYDLIPPREAFSRAKAAAARALDLDPDLAEAHTSLGYARFYHDWDWEGAEAAYRRAIALKPGYATAHQFYANALDLLGRVDEAEREWQRSLELDPLALIINAGLGWHLYFAGRFEPAVTALRRALEMDATFVPANVWLGLAYAQLGRPEESVAALADAVRHSENSPSTVAELARARALAGDTAGARELLAGLDARGAERYVPPYEVAGVHFALGDRDRGFDLLEQAFRDRSHSMAFMKVDPRFADLRDDRRYRDLLGRVGLGATAVPG